MPEKNLSPQVTLVQHKSTATESERQTPLICLKLERGGREGGRELEREREVAGQGGSGRDVTKTNMEVL